MWQVEPSSIYVSWCRNSRPRVELECWRQSATRKKVQDCLWVEGLKRFIWQRSCKKGRKRRPAAALVDEKIGLSNTDPGTAFVTSQSTQPPVVLYMGEYRHFWSFLLMVNKGQPYHNNGKRGYRHWHLSWWHNKTFGKGWRYDDDDIMLSWLLSIHPNSCQLFLHNLFLVFIGKLLVDTLQASENRANE